MSLLPRRKIAPPPLPKSGLTGVATSRQLGQRVQSAVSILAGGLRHPVEPEALYPELLLLTCRLLFLHLAHLDTGATGQRGIQQAVDGFRFLRAGSTGIEPEQIEAQALVEAMDTLRGEGRDTFTAHVLGSVYESLLAFHPVFDKASRTLQFATAAGNSRKTSGSYYTPDSLIQCLLDSALDPILSERTSEAAILSLKICDPSCGSGQFLLAAGTRIAGRLAMVRGTPGAVPQALRDVAQNCLYGVDLNPLAVELSRFHLWMAGATATPHIQWGDSLLGTLPGTVEHSLGASAFAPLLGDTPVAARAHHEAWVDALQRPTLRAGLADAWCAMLMWPRHAAAPPPPFRLALGQAGEECPSTLRQLALLVDEHRFFHWQQAFPEVFGDGFDVLLGNPPWERIEVQDKEWFARRAPHIKNAANASARKRLVAELETSDPELYRTAMVERRRSQAENHFVRVSGRFPLTGRGGINRYAPFTEACRQMLRPGGRVGYVVPSGLVHDENTRPFFHDLMATGSLLSLYHFDNRKKLFPAVGGMITFCLVTLGHDPAPGKTASFVCFAQQPSDLLDPRRRFELSAADLRLMNPNTETLPIFRSAADASLTREVYRKVPVVLPAGGDNPWSLHLSMLFQMSGDSGLFRTRPQLEAEGFALEGNVFRRGTDVYMPLYEAKWMHQFDHRWATWQGGKTVNVPAARKGSDMLPRYWVPAAEVDRRLRRQHWPHEWLLVWRDVCRSTDERTVIAAILPRAGVGHTAQLMFPTGGPAPLLLANLNSMVLDYVARQKIGGIHLTYSYLQQLPLLAPEAYDAVMRKSILDAVVELTYTSESLRAFALDHGLDRGPFAWDAERRAYLRAEVDARYFCLYGLDLADVEHVLSTFPILQRKEEARHGEYRTRRLILEALGRMGDPSVESALSNTGGTP